MTDPSILKKWAARMPLPTAAQIAACSRTATERSPYVVCWLEADGQTYDGYSVLFKADLLPPGTYCCPASFGLDYSSLLGRFRSVSWEYNTGGYAGFQKLGDGSLCAILSVWDVFGTGADGRRTRIRAKQLFPAGRAESFTGEGTGAHCLPKYEWKSGHWYEMLLLLGVSEQTGNTTITQYVRDTETNELTKLSAFDLAAPNVRFKGSPAVFLENFEEHYAGEVRTLEIARPFIRSGGKWTALRSACMLQNFDWPGSYRYGVDGGVFYMITTGVRGMVGRLQPQSYFTLNG